MDKIMMTPEFIASIFIITNYFAHMTVEEFIEWKTKYLENEHKKVETDMMCCCCDNMNNK